jgi:dTDP-4-amino-4,6-dideoxygalactose transaminase
VRDLDRLAGMLRDRFPEHPHVYIGLSGATLLHDALKQENRSSLVVPAFLCPSLSAMALAAGKGVTHIDSSDESMHVDAALLETFLEKQSAADTAVLIDHSFGYRCTAFAKLRRRFPNLLIIEDCARALGLNAGTDSDWILFSMYKTIRGSHNGGILLSRTPLRLAMGARLVTTIRERTARIPAVRAAYDFLQRFREPSIPPLPPVPAWTPQRGVPGEICVSRFVAELENCERGLRDRANAAAEIQQALGLGQINVGEMNKVESSAHFVTFRVSLNRDLLLRRLRRHGFFVSGTWTRVPSDYTAFSGTFPFGSRASIEWSRSVVHIPVSHFLKQKSRAHLLDILRCDLPAFR